MTPTYHLWSPAGDKPWYLHRGKTAAALHLNLTLGETNEGREAINDYHHQAQVDYGQDKGLTFIGF